MSKNSQVVDGEASESDSEIEVGKSPDLDTSSNKKEFVIVGEAPESDDESKQSIPSPLEPDLSLHSVAPPSPSHTIYNSLLHQKLWEANISFRATLEGLVKHTTDISVEKLSSTDKTLLNVQECMRATNANLTLARARIKQLRDTFEKANCCAAIPTVKTEAHRMIETRSIGTETSLLTTSEKIRRCGLQHNVQHIDIYGVGLKTRVCYSESTNKGCVSSILSLSPTRNHQNRSSISATSLRNLEYKLSRYSVKTKVCSSCPSSENKFKKKFRNQDYYKKMDTFRFSNMIVNNVVPRILHVLE